MYVYSILIREHTETISKITKNSSIINESDWLANPLWNDLNMESCNIDSSNEDNGCQVFTLIPEKHKSKIIKLSRVNDIKLLKGCTSLKELSFGEFFSIGGHQIIKPGDIPDSVEKIEFYIADSVTVEVGALPKNIKELVCGDNPKFIIKDTIPHHVKLSYCKKINKQMSEKVIKPEENKEIF